MLDTLWAKFSDGVPLIVSAGIACQIGVAGVDCSCRLGVEAILGDGLVTEVAVGRGGKGKTFDFLGDPSSQWMGASVRIGFVFSKSECSVSKSWKKGKH